MKYIPLALVVFLAGCSDMQMSPVAPSATSPAGATSVPPPVSTSQGYSVSLSANGGGSVGTWQSTLVVQASSGAVLPASVTVDCGNGSAPQFLPGFIGLKVIACVFDRVGDYTVTASVIAPNAVTTSSSIVVPVVPAPAAPQPPAQSLSISASRIGGTSTSVEWRFALVASTADEWSEVTWDFDDGSGASGSTVQQHRYTGNNEGTKTVRVFARSVTRGLLTARREIEVKFN